MGLGLVFRARLLIPRVPQLGGALLVISVFITLLTTLHRNRCSKIRYRNADS